MAHACNTSSRQAEAEGSRVRGQPGLNKTLCQKNKNKKPKRNPLLTLEVNALGPPQGRDVTNAVQRNVMGNTQQAGEGYVDCVRHFQGEHLLQLLQQAGVHWPSMPIREGGLWQLALGTALRVQLQILQAGSPGSQRAHSPRLACPAQTLCLPAAAAHVDERRPERRWPRAR